MSHEASFYTDQLDSRSGHISKDVDLKYLAEKQTELELAQVALKRGMNEESYIMEVVVLPPVSRSNHYSASIISLNCFGLPQLTVDNSDFSVQCCLSSCPSVRLVGNCTDTIKKHFV